MDRTVSYLTPDPENIHILPAGIFLKQRYQLQRLLGQGGFGITYLGWDHQQQTYVAVKEFFPQSIVCRDCSRSLEVRCNTQSLVPNFQSSKQRFLREASALERFRDIPAIVEISDYFEENNTAYIVMEYIAGVELKDYVARRGGRLSVDETLKLLEPVFEALIHVHRAGLVHRDISPDNIMLSSREGAKLLDFGAVRSVEAPGVDKALSHSTEAILKHGFAPIEQYNTRGSLGPWTDEYALCATIYYCLTGKVPEQVTLRLSEQIDLNWGAIPGLDANRCKALEKGMSIQPRDRFPDIGQLYAALYHSQTEPVGKPPEDPPRKPWKKILTTLAAAVLVVAMAFGVWKAVETLPDGKPPKNDGGKTGGTTEKGPEIYRPGTDPTDPSVETEPDVPEETMPSGTEETAPSAPEGPAEEETYPSRDWINNVITADPIGALLGTKVEGDTLEDYEDARNKVRSVVFLDKVEGAPEKPHYLGAGFNDSVIGWIKWNNGYADLYIAAEGGIAAPESCDMMFAGCCNMVYIDFGNAFHTESCESMTGMFYGCYDLQELDLRGFDTSRVTNMREMFRCCESLTDLKLGSFNTSRVTTMQGMFRECKSLLDLDVRSFDTSRVTNMSEMFSTCSGLQHIDLRNFDTSSLTNMNYMFSACHSLRSPDLGSFDTSKVVYMAGVFAWCGALEDLSVSWDVSSVKDHTRFMESGKTINGRPWAEYFQ